MNGVDFSPLRPPARQQQLLGLSLLVFAACAAAQVTPAEPFGGRPFGAPPGSPAPAQQPAPPVVVPQTQVVVQPPVPQPVPPAQPLPAPAAQAPDTGTAGGPPRQPMVRGALPQGMAPPQGQAQQPAAAPPPVAPPAPVAPPPPVSAPAPVGRPSSIAPPFTGAPGAAAAPAPAPAGTPVKGLPAGAPALVISGSVYSPNRSQRMLIVNGQPVREGAEVGGVVVQEVRREGAVLGFQGTSYNVLF